MRMTVAMVLVLLAVPAHGALTGAEARSLFERFKTLEGEWRGRSTKGWEDTKGARLIAGGSILMMTSFDAHPGETMVTMVHLDGDRLLLTHYCVAKNQPRLVATSWDEATGTAVFEFLDGTGMRSRDTGHMDKVVYRFVEADRYSSRWTWYQNGQERWLEDIEYRRVTE